MSDPATPLRPGSLTRPGDELPVLLRATTVVDMADEPVRSELASLEDVLHVGQLPVEPGGTDLGDGVRLSPARSHVENPRVTTFRHAIYRDNVHIGSVDYDACRACRCVMLGEIGLVDDEQRHGIGTRVLAQLRAELPGYRWFITPEKTGSMPFWAKIRAAYPGEYLLGARQHLGCDHLLF